jgi:hypothetical protein
MTAHHPELTYSVGTKRSILSIYMMISYLDAFGVAAVATQPNRSRELVQLKDPGG